MREDSTKVVEGIVKRISPAVVRRPFRQLVALPGGWVGWRRTQCGTAAGQQRKAGDEKQRQSRGVHNVRLILKNISRITPGNVWRLLRLRARTWPCLPGLR